MCSCESWTRTPFRSETGADAACEALMMLFKSEWLNEMGRSDRWLTPCLRACDERRLRSFRKALGRLDRAQVPSVAGPIVWVYCRVVSLWHISMSGEHHHDLTNLFMWFYCNGRVGIGQHGRGCPGHVTPSAGDLLHRCRGGAATLLVTPDRESILIDSGWPGQEDRDPKRIVHVLKDLAGCDRLDHLVTTHWHTDHFGGVAGLARLIEIAHFWDRGLPGGSRMPALTFRTGPSRPIPWGSPTGRPARASGKHSTPVIRCRSKDWRHLSWPPAGR